MYKKMYNVVTVGGPETTLGTAVTRTTRLPITGLTTVVEKANRAPSEVLTGRGTNRANYIDSIDLSMEIPMELQAHLGTGKLLMSAMGQDLATPPQIGGALRITYIGEEQSCKIVVTTTTITSTIGVLGAEAVDATFGTDGVLTLSAITVDTLAELAAVITAYAGYTAEAICGASAAATTTPVAIASAQICDASLLIYFVSANSGVYLHQFTPILTNTERPTISLQSDGTGLTYDILGGAVVDQITISADLKGQATMTATVTGTTATTGDASTVALLDKKPLKFSGAHIFLAGTDTPFTKSISITIANGHDADEGYGAGSLFKSDHAKGMFSVTGTASVRSTATTEVEYVKRYAESKSSILAIFQGDALATSIPEMVAISVPYIEIMDATKSESGVGIDTALNFEAVDPQSYSNIVTIDMLTTDSAKYN